MTHENSLTHSTLVVAAAFVLLWNSGFIGAEYGLPYAGTFTLLFWRYSALSLICFGYLAGRRRLGWPGGSRVATTAVVGILAHGVWLSCVLLALQLTVPAGIVALIVALQPLATGALSGWVTGEVTPLHRWIGLIMGFCGVAIPIVARIDPDSAKSVFGLLIPFGSVIAMTAATLIQRRLEVLNRDHRLPIDQALFYQSVATALVVAVPAIFLEGLTTHGHPIFLRSMVWLVLAVSLGAYALMWQLLSRIDATRLASLFYLGPPITMVMAWMAFGDTPHATDVIGLGVVFGGVALTQYQPKTGTPSPPA